MRHIACALLLALAALPAAAQTFSDGDFDPVNWTFIELETNEGGSVVSQVTSNGNPGNALEVMLSLEQAAGFSLIVGVWLWHEAYDPAVSGGFASIRHSEDAIYIEPGTGNGHATGIAIRQNDSVFIRNVAFTEPQTWTSFTGCGFVSVGDFSRLSGSGVLDFSDTAAPLELGFYRAVSHAPQGGGAGFRTGAIDNWSVTVVPSCATDGECNGGDGCLTDTCVDSICECEALDCDDGDDCTTDACSGGACSNPPLDCSDGNDCTADSCVGGFCMSPLSVDLPTVEAELQEALDTIEGSPCAEEEVLKKLRKKLRKKVKKALKKLSRTDDVTKDKVLRKLFTKSDTLLIAAQTIVGKFAQNGKISFECSAVLQTLIGNLQFCASGLPRPL